MNAWLSENWWWLIPVGLVLGFALDHWINGPDPDEDDCGDMYP